MTQLTKKQLEELCKQQSTELRAIHQLVESLAEDDIENSIQNAERCLRTHGRTLEIDNISKNRSYYAGMNNIINEVRDILGLDRLYLPGEKERLDEQAKLANMATQPYYDCPEIPDGEAHHIEGRARLYLLGDDLDTYLVMGTKSRAKALKMMRKYERDECGLYSDELVTDDIMDQRKIVWRRSDREYDYGEYGTFYSWDEKNTKHNNRAEWAFIVRRG